QHAKPALFFEREAFYCENGLRRFGRFSILVLIDSEQHFAPYHHLGHLLCSSAASLDLSDYFTETHYRHSFGDVENFSQLVRDDDDRLSLIAQRSQNAKELFGLLGSENCSRFI